MANLSMAIPLMQSDETDVASGGSAIVTEKSFVKFSTDYLNLNKKIMNNKKMIERVRERIDLDIERRQRRIGQPQRVEEEQDQDQEEEKSSPFGDILKRLLGLAKTLLTAFIKFGKSIIKWAFKLLTMLNAKTVSGYIKKFFTALLGKKFPFFKALGLGAVFGTLLSQLGGSESSTAQAKAPQISVDEMSEDEYNEELEESSAPAAAATPAAAPPPATPAPPAAPPPATPAPPAAPAQAAPASPPPAPASPPPAPAAPAAASAPPPAAAPAAEPAPKPKAEEQGKPEKVASPKERAKKEFGALDKGQALANQVGKIDDELEKLKEQADNIENDDDPKKVALMKRIEELENKRDNVSKQQDSLDKPDKFDKFAAKKTKGDRAFDEDAKGKPDRIDKALDDDGEIRKPKIPAGAPTKVTQTTTKESEETTTGGGSTLSSRVSDKPSEEYLAAEKKYKDALAELKAARKIKAPKDKIKELMNKVSEYRKAKSKLKPKTRMATSTTPSELKSNKTKSSDTTVIIKPVVKKKVVSDW